MRNGRQAWLVAVLVLVGASGRQAHAQSAVGDARVYATERVVIGGSTFGSTSPLQVIGLPALAGTLVTVDGSGYIGSAGAATAPSSLGVTGAFSANGSVGLGDAAGDAINVTGRINTSILWTADNAVDLGASGANRARDFFLARNAAVGGTLGVTGASTLAALSATTGSFSSTLGVTGNTTLAALSATTGTFSSTLGVTGPATFSGGGTVVSGQSLATSYSSGWAGAGYHLGYNTSFANQSFLEVDRLNVRGVFSVYELLVHQIRATNGSIFVANTGRAKTVTGTGPYTIDTEDVHGFAVNDLIRAQRFTGTGTYQSDMTVTSVPSSTQFVATLRATYAAPVAGMDFVRLGNTGTADRQGSIYLTADDTNAPYINVLDGVASFTDWGSSAKNRVRIGNLNGACGYATNIYGFCAGDYAANAVTVDAPNGVRFLQAGTVQGSLNGTSWTLGRASTASRSSVQITDSKIAMRYGASDTERVVLNSDGSGALAGGNISWDTAGNTTFTGTVNVTGGTAAKTDFSNVNPTTVRESTGWGHAMDTTQIDGGDVRTGTITANKMSLQAVAGASLIPDPNFADPTSWGVTSGTVTISDGKAGKTAWQNTGGSYISLESTTIAVDPTKTYRVRFYARTTVETGSGVLYGSVNLYDSAGTELGGGPRWYYFASAVVPGSGWTLYEATFGAGTAMPFHANGRVMTMGFLVSYSAGTRVFQLQDARIEEMTPGSLIVDGAITAAKIATGSIAIGYDLTANNTGQFAIDSDSIDFRWRNNVGSTSSLFSIAKNPSSNDGYAVLLGSLQVVDSGVGVYVNKIQNQSGSTLTLKALSGTVPEIIIDTSAIGALRPLTSGVGGLGSSTYKWGAMWLDTSVAANQETGAAYPMVDWSGQLKAKTDGRNGTVTCTAGSNVVITMEYGIVTSVTGTGCS